MCDHLKRAWVAEVFVHGVFELFNLLVHVIAVFFKFSQLLKCDLEQLFDAKA